MRLRRAWDATMFRDQVTLEDRWLGQVGEKTETRPRQNC
jgi:hypothetical protein